MKLDIHVSLAYLLGAQRTALLALEAARTDGQNVLEDHLHIADAEVSSLEGEWGVGRRSWISLREKTMRLNYRATVSVTRNPTSLSGLSQADVTELSSELVTFLRPSRYCQSDLLERFAADHFGHLTGGAKIAAILEWIEAGMTYDPFHSTAETTAMETFAAQRGVCRDYAHLLCALARASHIPARYVSGYGLSVDPPDFHAVVQVWLENAWHMVDPTGMCRPDEIAMIAVGRDAADVPFMETPDEARFLEQNVRVTVG
ncbi:transglutaminase-like domain-containing protein [Lutimaribacter saemankumensis]|uniref:Transglutaminase-like superfamily protein n=1 Tax=Lutimaribacter saemankumensis TaxID=490829 RepID=A0A1G8GE19_9RHOB|nr:transglutaminase family protein [Lutimaribacter saemankumensis]SDH92576.1 Transglutaminase-like superfamily protein [Lutimaribacter saemankumensis]